MQFQKLTSLVCVIIGMNMLSNITNAQTQNLYGHFDIGYASHDWQGDFGSFGINETWSTGHGGTVYGFDLGYTFYGPFSIEVGYMSLPKATVTIPLPPAGNYSFSTNVWYGALRGTYQLSSSLDFYAKLGMASQDASGSAIFNNQAGFAEGDHLGVLYGTGFEYHLTNNLLLGAEYLFVDGKISSGSLGARTTLVPKANIFMASLGYQFDI